MSYVPVPVDRMGGHDVSPSVIKIFAESSLLISISNMARVTRSSTHSAANTEQEHLDSQSAMSSTTRLAKMTKAATSTASRKRGAPTAAGTKASASTLSSLDDISEGGKPKRQKGTKAVAQPTIQVDTPNIVPQSTVAPQPYQPSLLPPSLIFSFADAQQHLALHDARFGVYFDNIPCKPFAPPLKAIDPFRTLVTSIIGQQVSWMAAKAINQRFRALFGFNDDAKMEDSKEDDEDNRGGFPSPAMVLAKDVITLKSVGLSMRKAEYGERGTASTSPLYAHDSQVASRTLPGRKIEH